MAVSTMSISGNDIVYTGSTTTNITNSYIIPNETIGKPVTNYVIRELYPNDDEVRLEVSNASSEGNPFAAFEFPLPEHWDEDTGPFLDGVIQILTELSPGGEVTIRGATDKAEPRTVSLIRPRARNGISINEALEVVLRDPRAIEEVIMRIPELRGRIDPYALKHLRAGVDDLYRDPYEDRWRINYKP